MARTRPRRPSDFEVAIICALTIEADAVEALFDEHWDDLAADSSFNQLSADLDTQSLGSIGDHNVVLAQLPKMGKAAASRVATQVAVAFPNIKVAIITGICGAVPFVPDLDGELKEIVLGDVVISTSVVQYDLGRQLPEDFVRKNTLSDNLGPVSFKIATLLKTLERLRNRKKMQNKINAYLCQLQENEPELAATYPGVDEDRLFPHKYRHQKDELPCDSCGCCKDQLLQRTRLADAPPEAVIHFGPIASSDTVMKSAEHRNEIAKKEGVIAFEMEGAGAWDSFPCVIIKGACDYADSHKSKKWQRYAAATAACCVKAFLENWSSKVLPFNDERQPSAVHHIVPYTRNPHFIGRQGILDRLPEEPFGTDSQVRTSLCGLGGVGKTQIAIEYAFRLKKNHPDMSTFWIHASSTERFHLAYTTIAQHCQIEAHKDTKNNILQLVKDWLESKHRGNWLMIIDNADDVDLFSPEASSAESAKVSDNRPLKHYIPECSHGAVMITTRNKQVGIRLTQGRIPIEVVDMDEEESQALMRTKIVDKNVSSESLDILSARLEHLPLAMAQAAAYIEETGITVDKYLELLGDDEAQLSYFLNKDFETSGRDSETPRAVAKALSLSLQQIENRRPIAFELLSLMSMLDRQDIPQLVLRSYYLQRRELTEDIAEIQLVEGIGVLKAFSFVSETTNGSYDMHRLVQIITRDWLEAQGRKARFAFEALNVIFYIFPEDRQTIQADLNHGGLPFGYQTLLSHCRAVLKVSEVSSEQHSLVRAELEHLLGFHLYSDGRFTESESPVFESVRKRTKSLGVDDPLTMESQCLLADIYRGQSRLKDAESLLKLVYERALNKPGNDDRFTIRAKRSIATLYADQRRFEEAIALLQELLANWSSKNGREESSMLETMLQLADIYESQGYVDESKRMKQKISSIIETSLRSESSLLTSSRVGEASNRSKGDKIIEEGGWAALLMSKLRQQVTESGRSEVLKVLTVTIMLCESSNFQDEAEQVLKELLQISVDLYGREHPGSLRAASTLALIWSAQGFTQKAYDMEAEILRVWKRRLGPHHPLTLSSMIEAALHLFRLNRWEEGEMLCLDVVDRARAFFANDHPRIWRNLHVVARRYGGHAKSPKSIKLLSAVAQLSEAKLGSDHQYTLDIKESLRAVSSERRDGLESLVEEPESLIS